MLESLRKKEGGMVRSLIAAYGLLQKKFLWASEILEVSKIKG